MTIEQKAKAYDEAIGKLREFYRDYDTVSNLIDVKEELANILPELRESEDDRIRKGIIRNLEYLADRAEGFVKDELKERIAWLEKQSKVEEAMREVKEKAEAFTQAHKGETSDDILAQMRGEQKPTWSEDDEEMLDGIILRCEKYGYQEQINWLKSLKDKVQPQPVEWSKEDEDTIKFLISHFCTCYPTNTFQFTTNEVITHDELLRKIRHLRLQPQWKPSKEQINGIECAIKTLQHQLNVGDKRLNSLYDDLKKLMEE